MRAQRHRRSAFLLLRIAWATFIASVLVAVVWPSFSERMRRTRISEPIDRLARLHRASSTYWYAAGERGEGLRAFPDTAPRAPAVVPRGTQGNATAQDFAHPTWRALEFRFEGLHYYSYEYVSSGSGATAAFTARAVGDLDGNGVQGTFERSGRATAEQDFDPGQGLWIRDALE